MAAVERRPVPARGGVLILAHEGGWDETAFVLAPVAVITLLLWIASRRVAKKIDNAGGAEGETARSSEPDRGSDDVAL